MKRLFALLLGLVTGVFLLAGCGASSGGDTYQDGTYTARFKEASPNEYIDFLEVTVADGAITSMRYDAYHKDDSTRLRSADEVYERDMEKVSGTYPRRYQADLVNQYLEKGSIGEVTEIAGATWSSRSFKALFTALEPSLYSGDTETVLVDNVPPI